MQSWRSVAVAALGRIRAIQLKIRLSVSRMEREEAGDYAVKLLAVSEILERIALKLETAVYTGIASESIAESVAVLSLAFDRFKHSLPPPLQHDALSLQEELRDFVKSAGLDVLDVAVEVLDSDVERVLREAESIAREKAKSGGARKSPGYQQ